MNTSSPKKKKRNSKVPPVWRISDCTYCGDVLCSNHPTFMYTIHSRLFVGISDFVTPAIDVYAFGMCALEMASLEIQGNGDSGTLVTQDHINRTVESLDDPLQKDLIRQCLTADFEQRPSARTLLFHPVLYEVHALKLLAAHALVKTGKRLLMCHVG